MKKMAPIYSEFYILNIPSSTTSLFYDILACFDFPTPIHILWLNLLFGIFKFIF